MKSFHDEVPEFLSGDVEKRVLAEQIKKDIFFVNMDKIKLT